MRILECTISVRRSCRWSKRPVKLTKASIPWRRADRTWSQKKTVRKNEKQLSACSDCNQRYHTQPRRGNIIDGVEKDMRHAKRLHSRMMYSFESISTKFATFLTCSEVKAYKESWCNLLIYREKHVTPRKTTLVFAFGSTTLFYVYSPLCLTSVIHCRTSSSTDRCDDWSCQLIYHRACH